MNYLFNHVHAAKEHKPSYLLLSSNVHFFVGLVLLSGKETSLKNTSFLNFMFGTGMVMYRSHIISEVRMKHL